MTTPRLYSPHDLAGGQALVLEPDQAHYLLHVLRCGEGAVVDVFNEACGVWRAILHTGPKRKTATLHVQDCTVPPAPPGPGGHLLCPPLRQNRLDWLLEKACEMGLRRLTPVLTDHTAIRQVSPDRLRRIARESAEQSERTNLVHIDPLTPLDALWPALVQKGPVHVAVERSPDILPFTEALQAFTPKPEGEGPVMITGPEGGWSPREKTLFRTMAAVKPVHLGPSVVRSETAALMMISAWTLWRTALPSR